MGGKHHVSEESPYPNNLIATRKLRGGMTREDLSAKTRALAASDPSSCLVTVAYLQKLERGKSLPRERTASTLAKALGLSVQELFPAGLRTGSNNPSGRPQKT